MFAQKFTAIFCTIDASIRRVIRRSKKRNNRTLAHTAATRTLTLAHARAERTPTLAHTRVRGTPTLPDARATYTRPAQAVVRGAR